MLIEQTENSENGFNDKKKRLLIVDDVDEIRKVYINLVQSYFDVKEAGTGAQALELFETFCPHVVFLDVRLAGTKPSLQGTELLKLMKALRPGTAICMVSADGGLKESLLQSGADDFIEKPCSRGELFDFLIAKGLLEVINK